jgi:hypothetical protein
MIEEETHSSYDITKFCAPIFKQGTSAAKVRKKIASGQEQRRWQ